MFLATVLEGISFCPEAVACVFAARQLLRDGRLQADERVVLFETASDLNYQDAALPDLPRLPADAPVESLERRLAAPGTCPVALSRG